MAAPLIFADGMAMGGKIFTAAGLATIVGISFIASTNSTSLSLAVSILRIPTLLLSKSLILALHLGFPSYKTMDSWFLEHPVLWGSKHGLKFKNTNIASF
jgi:hypothetical protein